MHIRRNRNTTPRSMLVVFLSISWMSCIQAAEVAADFSAGVGNSDNIALAESNEIDETFGTLGFRFELTELTRTTDARIRADFDYVQYFQNTFDDELIGGLDAFAEYAFVEERVSWVIQDNFGQLKIDPFAPPRPDNRENINHFSTGPNLTFPLGERNEFGIDLRYSDIAYETQAFDSTKTSARGSLRRNTNKSSSVSLNVFVERTEYDNAGLSPDYDRREAYVRFDVSSARNVIGVDLGYTELEIEGETGTGVVARIDWKRQVSPFSTFTFNGGSQYSDQGNIFQFDQGTRTDLTETGQVGDLGVPFQNNYANLGYTLARDRTSVTIRLGWNQEDYKQGGDLDSDTTRFDAILRRDLSRKIFAELGLRYYTIDYKYQDRKDDYSNIRVTTGYRFGPAISVSLNYQFSKRDSSAAGENYVENRAFLLFSYIPGWGR